MQRVIGDAVGHHMDPDRRNVGGVDPGIGIPQLLVVGLAEEGERRGERAGADAGHDVEVRPRLEAEVAHLTDTLHLDVLGVVLALRHVGTARAGAYFSIAPFFGAVLAIAVLSEPLTPQLVLAGGLMALGTWLHVTERHSHSHTHEAVTHDHWHTHDDGHHDHVHAAGDVVEAGVRHRHVHTHEAITHSHEHYPDAHHRHDH